MDHIPSHAREKELGIEVFFTDTPGVGGKLRKDPEDFVVEEISDFPEKDENGRYTIAKVTSINWEMNRLVRQLAKSLRISRNKIGFAGTKDKRAVTTQLMSFEAPIENVTSLYIHQVAITDAYRARKPITIGDLIGNFFKIRIRECLYHDEELAKILKETLTILERSGGFPNFFGIQRFGAIRPITHHVGKYIIKRDFERAVMTYVANPTDYESEEVREARQNLEETRDFETALRVFPKKLLFERTVISHLVKHPEDYAGAIRSLPGNLQMMFVHAYQSYLFNKILSERIRREFPLNRPTVGDIILPADAKGLPDHDHYVLVTEENIDLAEKRVAEDKAFVSGVLFGSESEFAEGEMGAIEREIIENEGITKKDFVVPELPQCSSRGSRRELLARMKNLTYFVENDEVLISFSLDRGCYATALLREIMKADVISY
jgi:tRNA pseudouridine13 synthase